VEKLAGSSSWAGRRAGSLLTDLTLHSLELFGALFLPSRITLIMTPTPTRPRAPTRTPTPAQPWPFPTALTPTRPGLPKFNPDNFEDAPL